MASNTTKGRKRDIGWEHGEMIGNNRSWTKCKYCGKEMKGSGVSRLKQHIAGGFSNVEKCEKCPAAIAKAMRDHLDGKKGENEEAVMQRQLLRDTLMEPIRRRHGLIDDDSDSDGIDREHLNIAMQRSLEDIQEKQMGRIRTDHPSSYFNGAGYSNHSQQHNKYFEGDNKLKRKAYSLGSKAKGLRLEDMDPSIYRNRECTQQKISNMWKGNSTFKSAKHAIGKWFIFSNIPPNAAANPYFQTAIDEIARAGVGMKGPTPYEITGPILDAEIEEIKEYVSNFKKKWEVYGVTIMCDGWSSTTKLAIINFLIYCDGKIVFHKSVNASSRDKDADYIYELMDDVVEEIGEKYVVQVITDNGSAYKKAGELLMRKRKHLYWTPCAAHCIDLMLEDFADKTTVKVVIEEAKRISNFIYNHHKILDIMRKYTNGKELLRPGITRFATNYIAVESILEQKSNLQRMFTSEDWSKNSASKDPSGKRIHDLILNSGFWKSAEIVCNLHAPVSLVLRMVDGEKQATMGYVYEGMRRSKLAIEATLPRSHKKYCDIIDNRLQKQMLHDIHLAAYYLNPCYHYELELSHQQVLLDALKRVVQKLEPDDNAATLAISEGKYFREAMYGFADSTAIKGRKKTAPAEWWFHYGTDAPNLRKVALRILSQTASSSGCERNWSTFALIHTKVRNRLNYQKLERLVYVHYNMRLKLRHLIKDKTRVDQDFQPIDLSHIFDDNDVLSEWLDDPGDALLDEFYDDGQPARPNTFLSTWADRLSGRSKNGAGSSKGKGKLSKVVDVVDEDDEFDFLLRETSGKRTNVAGSSKGKGKLSDIVDIVDEDHEFDFSSRERTRKRFEDNGCDETITKGVNVGDFVESDYLNGLSNQSKTDDNNHYAKGTGGEFSSWNQSKASQEGIFFTEEENFDHATQDEDHGSRRSKC